MSVDDKLIQFAHRLADASGAVIRPFFRQRIEVRHKQGRHAFDPVTEADRGAERAIRAIIERERPHDAILGEEYGPENTDRSHVWVIDPIDGTRAFISGLPVWGTLVGLTVDGDARAGMMSQPFTGELFYSDGEGAYLLREGDVLGNEHPGDRLIARLGAGRIGRKEERCFVRLDDPTGELLAIVINGIEQHHATDPWFAAHGHRVGGRIVTAAVAHDDDRGDLEGPPGARGAVQRRKLRRRLDHEAVEGVG